MSARKCPECGSPVEDAQPDVRPDRLRIVLWPCRHVFAFGEES